MDPLTGKIVLNGAPSQLDRFAAALAPGYAPVDGRPFPELLDFATRFGRLVRFYDLDNQADGDWVPFFLTDPTMVLASMAQVDVRAIEKDYLCTRRATARAHVPARKFHLLRELFELIQGLARRLNGWLEALEGVPDSEALRRQLTAAITGGLAEQLRTLEAYDKGAGLKSALGQPIGLDWSGFLPLWELAGVCPDGAIYRGVTYNRKIDHALPFLDPIFYAFLDALADFQAGALAALPETLGGGRHKPQIALYIAFIRLFASAQATIDTLSSRYAHFYDREVLREPHAPAIPDSVYLTFALADDEGVARAPVPRGTLFPAGQDAAGREILYAADRDLTVTRARIAKLRTLRALPGLPGPDGLGAAPRRVLASEIAVDPETGAQGDGTAWPTFGPASAGVTGAGITLPATLGFALAAADLLLTGGERAVAIDLDVTFQGSAPPADLLALVLTERLALYASTAGGWFRIEGHSVAVGTSTLTFRFTLPAAAPPLTALTAPAPGEEPAAGLTGDPEVLATDPAPGLPTLKAYLSQEPVAVATPDGTVWIDPLPVVYGLEILAAGLSVEVRGLADLELENVDGGIDPTAPFPVFGAQPVVGSFLQMRSAELFGKTPESLRVTVRWFDLPPNDTGFAGWYKDYTLGLDGLPQEDLFDNQTFLGAWSVRDPGTWTLGELSPPSLPPTSEDVFLFRTRDDCAEPVPAKAGPLCQESRFDGLAVVPRERPRYYDPAASALRLELTAPPYGFGDVLYAQNVLNAVIEDLPIGTEMGEALACSPPRELRYPNAPWLPVAERVRVDYTVRAARPDFFHLLPFGGWERPEEAAAAAATPLLPRIPDAGTLYLGFTGLAAPQTLPLLFQMAGNESAAELPPVSWGTLEGDRWAPLAPRQILGDSTNGLQHSGLLALCLPAFRPAAAAGTTLPPAGLQWLRATVASDPGSFPGTVAVAPHALLATWVDDGAGGEHLGRPLPPGTITGSVQELPDVAAIAQPLESFGGRPREDRRAFEIRLGERLRHKDRAILAWDYERLVLERFPTVWKVRALPARTPEAGNAPGDVLVVVVPGPDSLDAVDPTVPKAPADQLDRIKTYLEGLASPFVRLHVVNPVYVRITVDASVQFTRDSDPGTNIERLNTDLVDYLSPWYYDAARAARQGRYASEADISEFIQTRPYVEGLDCITFSYDPAPETLEWCFLTSAPAHRITPV
jgi:hypothetical protein